jgi:hypothetical protein
MGDRELTVKVYCKGDVSLCPFLTSALPETEHTARDTGGEPNLTDTTDHFKHIQARYWWYFGRGRDHFGFSSDI